MQRLVDLLKGSPCTKMVINVSESPLTIDIKSMEFQEGIWMSQRNAFLAQLQTTVASMETFDGTYGEHVIERGE